MDRLKLPNGPGRVTLAAVPDGFDALVVARIAQDTEAGALFVAADDKRLAAVSAALGFFAPALTQIVYPAWDCLPYDRVSPNPDLVARRLDALSTLNGLKSVGLADHVVLTTAAAVSQRTVPAAVLDEQAVDIRVSERLDPDRLQGFLAANGFHRVGTVMEPGDYAVRGGLIDLFPPGWPDPVRIDLFGDEVEAIRTFDSVSQRTKGKTDRVRIVPASEISLSAEAIDRFRQGYRGAFEGRTTEDPLYESITHARRFMGAEHWLPLFHDELATLFDFVPAAPVILDHQLDEVLAARWDTIVDHHRNRRVALDAAIRGGEDVDAVYKPLPPESLYLDADAIAAHLAPRTVARITPFAEDDQAEAQVVNLVGRRGRDFGPERSRQENVFDALADHLVALKSEGHRILLASFSLGARERLAQVLADHGIEAVRPVETVAEARDLPNGAIGLAVLPVERGFVGAGWAIIGEQDILGDRLARPRRRTRQAENFLTEVTGLEAGDLVVHFEHGIGRFEGLTTLEISGAPHDCVHLTYAGEDRLYVPVENIDVLSRYGGADTVVALDKMGGGAWQARRAKLKQRLKDMADELIKVAATRRLRTGETLAAPEALYAEFCARFPYDETDDQSRAIADTLADLESGRPMDRLVCGDVGFGKTEVALRAAFSAVMAGKQVAVVVPTTLLARQHYKTFSERFAGLPVEVRQLSRLVTGKPASETRKGVKDGTVDIVIGTHAILGKAIGFARLGLLIVDEEQHFGVRHKERLKQLKSDVHVLTLSATPIPRTLQLALTGVKELSLIATPPIDRLAVRTFVMPHDPVVVREALLREHYRGGQSFYVCPRIEDLEGVFKDLKSLVPEVKVVSAHGRMPAAELEEVMNAFYDGKYDVLLSTSIVESGLDIPTANTMIVHRADMFGLAQLYQMRGRIGRSKTRGYAYLTTPARKRLNKVAERRLGILQTLDTLGAGFTLASHDLDLRGAGNILGEEQSGHIREVGFELYQEMLEEAVAEARRARDGDAGAEEGDGHWSPSINVGASVMIPETFVSDLGTRMALYRRLGSLNDRAEVDAFAAELVDRFGTLPEPVQHLLTVVEIKQLCRSAGIERIDAGPKGGTVTFRENRFADPAGLVAFIAAQGRAAKLRPDHKLTFMKDWSASPKARLKGVKALAGDLATIAAGALPAA